MRTLWIALLIALLPLRGWVGDAMAVAMAATPHAPAAVAVAAADDCPHSAFADMAPAHGEHVAGHPLTHSAHGSTHGGEPAPGLAQNATDDVEHGSVGAHLLCDVCNGPVLSTTHSPAPAAAQEHGLRIARSVPFASLTPRHVVKPPIA